MAQRTWKSISERLLVRREQGRKGETMSESTEQESVWTALLPIVRQVSFDAAACFFGALLVYTATVQADHPKSFAGAMFFCIAIAFCIYFRKEKP